MLRSSWLYLSLFFYGSSFAQDFTEPNQTNPFTGEQFESMVVSPTYYHSRFRTQYYYRYVTLYNEVEVQEVIDEYPRIKEFCHEFGNRFAAWSIKKVFTRNISSSFGLNLLGIDISVGGGFGQDVVFAFERWIIAEAGIEAIHTPMIYHTERRGITYQQTFYPKTGQSVNTRLNREEFFVDYIDPMFVAHREVTAECN